MNLYPIIYPLKRNEAQISKNFEKYDLWFNKIWKRNVSNIQK